MTDDSKPEMLKRAFMLYLRFGATPACALFVQYYQSVHNTHTVRGDIMQMFFGCAFSALGTYHRQSVQKREGHTSSG